jgi:hypothetical protein
MRTKTNILLAAMAFADIGCILCLLPFKIVWVSGNFDMRQQYKHYFNDHMLGLSNCFSAASTTRWEAALIYWVSAQAGSYYGKISFKKTGYGGRVLICKKCLFYVNAFNAASTGAWSVHSYLFHR